MLSWGDLILVLLFGATGSLVGIVGGVACVNMWRQMQDWLWLRRVRKSAPAWAHREHPHDWRGM
jgi:uncharacterized protein (DUF2062 family)